MASVRLSIVMSCHGAPHEWCGVLARSGRWLSREDTEVVLMLTDPKQEAQALATLAAMPRVRWRVLVNDSGAPCLHPPRAINAGLRNCRGEFVLVLPDNALFAGDVPRQVLEAMESEPFCAVSGQAVRATPEEVSGRAPEDVFESHARAAPVSPGGLCTRRSVFRALRGYDEALTPEQGALAEVELKLRLQLHGVALFVDEDLHFVELARSTEARSARIPRPSSPIANPQGWGRLPARVVLDWLRRERSDGN